ncbi:MAG: phage tail protein [Rhodobacterales bacterium]|nr:phage tail protein [Rhodobacterales bacterium]
MARTVRLPAFLRLDPLLGWRLSSLTTAVAEDPATGVLGLAPTGSRLSPLVDAGGSFGGLTLPTGVAIAPDGRILVADPGGQVILQHPHQGLFGADAATASGFAPLWPAPQADGPDTGDCVIPSRRPALGPYQLVRPGGLCFTADGDLAVIDQGNDEVAARLLIYSWPDMAVRHLRDLQGRPWGAALGPDRHLYLADEERGRIDRLDRQWQPDGGDPVWQGGAGVLNRPRHLAFDAQGVLLVIDTDPATGLGRLVRLDRLGRATVLTTADQRAIWGQVFAPPLTRSADGIHPPASGCKGPGPALRKVTVSRQGRLPQGPQLLYLAQETRLQYKGTIISAPLDSQVAGFAWHRIMLEADIPPTTALEVRTLTSDVALEDSRLDEEPEENWSRRIVLTAGQRPELLVQSGPGRYLWVQIGLVGDGTVSPGLRGIDIAGPRSSSLRLLPEPFHEDPVSRDFVDRLLSYFDTAFAEVEAGITRFPATLAAHAAPEGAFLAWLASWFDIRFLAAWPEATRRAFLARADEICRKRGTIAGLKAVLQLHLGVASPLPALVETFRLRDYGARRSDAGAALANGHLRLGGLEMATSGTRADHAHRFVLILPEALVPTPADRATLVDLVNVLRPAHTAWSLIVVPQGIRIGCQSTLGVDMVLGGQPSSTLGEMRLHQDARLPAPPHPPPRLGQFVLRAP